VTTLFQKAKDWLFPKVQAAAGESVTYTRGATTLSLTAVVGRTIFSSTIETVGARIEFGERDYLILASDLSSLGTPALGDRITETVGGSTRVYEVLPPASGDPPWRWSDPGMTIFRIHVKQVTTA
jgi:hypothetical protein